MNRINLLFPTRRHDPRRESFLPGIWPVPMGHIHQFALTVADFSVDVPTSRGGIKYLYHSLTFTWRTRSDLLICDVKRAPLLTETCHSNWCQPVNWTPKKVAPQPRLLFSVSSVFLPFLQIFILLYTAQAVSQFESESESKTKLQSQSQAMPKVGRHCLSRQLV